MVDLVDILVEGTPVQGAVGPIVPCILKNKEDGDLICDCEKGGERDTCC